jgi:hypothetical protein
MLILGLEYNVGFLEELRGLSRDQILLEAVVNCRDLKMLYDLMMSNVGFDGVLADAIIDYLNELQR